MPDAIPQNPSTRNFARVLIAISIFAVCIGLLLAAFRILSITQLCIRLGAVAALSSAGIWLYPRLQKWMESRTPERQSLVQILPAVIKMCWIYPVILIMFSGTRLGGATVPVLSMMPLMIGIAIAGAGTIRRLGDSLHCPHCEYPFTFSSEFSPETPLRCPECGKGWLGILKKGRRVKSPGLIVFGIAFAICATCFFNPIFYIGALAPHLPTPILFASSYFLPTNSYTAWDELATRSLPPFWTTLMANRVLGLRQHNPYETSSRWFEKSISGGTLPPELIDRYYLDGFRADLHIPSRVKAGEPFSAALRVAHTSDNSGSHGGLLLSGYYIDDNPVPLGRQHETQWIFKFNLDFLASHRDVLPCPITLTHKGDIRIRMVYWLVYQPSFTDQLQWQPDGTPAPIPSALWSRRFELTKTIRVD